MAHSQLDSAQLLICHFLWAGKSPTLTAEVNLGWECLIHKTTFLCCRTEWDHACIWHVKVLYRVSPETWKHRAFVKQQLDVSVGSVWIMHEQDLVLCTRYSDVLNLWLSSWLAELFLAKLCNICFYSKSCSLSWSFEVQYQVCQVCGDHIGIRVCVCVGKEGWGSHACLVTCLVI